jgi:large subunit ribosomal protein L21
MAYSIINIDGKQQKVEKNTTLSVNKLKVEKNQKLEFPVLFHSSDGKSQINPKLKAEAKVLKEQKGPKTQIIKFKNKTRSHKKNGHRQIQSIIKITDIK